MRAVGGHRWAPGRSHRLVPTLHAEVPKRHGRILGAAIGAVPDGIGTRSLAGVAGPLRRMGTLMPVLSPGTPSSSAIRAAKEP
jgi:hypothetical protein